MQRHSRLSATFTFGAALAAFASAARAQFVHPGCLTDQNDINRMQVMVSAGASPWIGGWNNLTASSFAQNTWTPSPVADVVRGCSSTCTENYTSIMRDAAAAYQNALRYTVSGDTSFADCAVNILNAWQYTLTTIDPCCSDHYLLAGLQGYQFACAAELLRNYPGWAPSDFSNFQQWMMSLWYPINHAFLANHNGACISHYWCNWDACNMASMIAIGVLCDNQSVFNEAVNYYKTGAGNGALEQAIFHDFGAGLGQWQESGRDQGHTQLGVGLESYVCEIAWKQGVDLYGYTTGDGKVLSDGTEYVASYNLGNSVPYATYNNCDNVNQTIISATSRGIQTNRNFWDMTAGAWLRKGRSAPYTAQMAAALRPDHGGGYGSTGASWAFDHLGFSTLTHYIEDAATPYFGDTDVGSVATAGSQSYSGGTWTVSGSGSDVGSTSDSFNFSHESLRSDGTFIARLASTAWTGSAGKIGIMMRETTAADAKQAWIFIDHKLSDTLRMAYRSSTGGTTSYVGSGPGGVAAPEWLALHRSGSAFTASYSADGKNWTQLGGATISMASVIEVGLAVCSRTTGLATANFDNASVTSP